MANNYLQFSTEITLADEEQTEWARGLIEFLGRWEEWREEAGDPYSIVANLIDDYLDVTVELSGGNLWIYADESGTPENAAAIIQAYLRKFDPEGCSGFEWANYCSKPRPDEFGGGAVFITADKQEWMHSSTWLSNKTSAFKEAQVLPADPEQYNHIFTTFLGLPPDKNDRPLCGAVLSDAWDFAERDRPDCPECARIANDG
jgi:hypothetical protein